MIRKTRRELETDLDKLTEESAEEHIHEQIMNGLKAVYRDE